MRNNCFLATLIALTIMFCGSAAAQEKPKPDHAEDVELQVRDNPFPVLVTWEVDGVSREVPADGKIKIPAGNTTLQIKARESGAFYVWADLVHNNERKFLGWSRLTNLRTKSGDRLRVVTLQPAPTWNSAMVRYKGKWMLVSLRDPIASMNVKAFEEGAYQGDEKLPNSPLFWAKAGPKAMADDAAEYFIKNRADKKTWGVFRNKMHVRLHFPCDPDGSVAEPFKSITKEELAASILEAMELIKRQRNPTGKDDDTYENEIERAKKLLKDGRPGKSI